VGGGRRGGEKALEGGTAIEHGRVSRRATGSCPSLHQGTHGAFDVTEALGVAGRRAFKDALRVWRPHETAVRGAQHFGKGCVKNGSVGEDWREYAGKSVCAILYTLEEGPQVCGPGIITGQGHDRQLRRAVCGHRGGRPYLPSHFSPSRGRGAGAGGPAAADHRRLRRKRRSRFGEGGSARDGAWPHRR